MSGGRAEGAEWGFASAAAEYRGACRAVLAPLCCSQYPVSISLLRSNYFRILPIVNTESSGGRHPAVLFCLRSWGSSCHFFFLKCKSLPSTCLQVDFTTAFEHTPLEKKATGALAEHPWSDCSHPETLIAPRCRRHCIARGSSVKRRGATQRGSSTCKAVWASFSVCIG